MDKKKINKIEEVSKEAEKEMERRDVLDILLDEDNKEPIVLSDEEGKRFTFEQIAVIPYNDKVYAVLKPVDHIDGVNDDEAIVFVVDERPTGSVLMVESDEKVAISVFDEYYNLLDEAEEKKAAKKTAAKKTTKKN
jgi:uncharacterized protein YrzB (UPF0473 family)